MSGSTGDTFNSVLCCYLNILFYKRKYYAPAKIFIPLLAEKVLHDHSPMGFARAFDYLKRSWPYVKQVTKGWKLYRCAHCKSNKHEPDSYYFVHIKLQRRCDNVCIECGVKIEQCTSCDGICGCCERNVARVIKLRQQHPTHFFTNCIKKNRNLVRFYTGDLDERCCSKYYHLFDDMTRTYWQEYCEKCQDRIECLLTRGEGK